MLFIPLPFVAAVLLLILFGQMCLREQAASRHFRILVLLLCLLAIVIGVRWGYGIERVLPAQAILASAVGPLAWVCFAAFVTEQDNRLAHRFWPHLLPSFLVAILTIARPQWIDVTLIAIFAWYAVALGRLAWAGTDALDLARFDDAPLVHRSLQVMATTMLLAAIADSLIAMDLRVFDGSHAATIVTAATIPLVMLLGAAAAIASRNPSSPAPEAVQPTPASDDDAHIVARLKPLLQTQGLYRDHDLNLSRLARRAGIPTRQLSKAVNSVCGKNLSHYVNDFRIAEACRLLESGDIAITTIVYDVGFLTKSNFNREFRRVTGMSPTEWRAKRTPGPAQAVGVEKMVNVPHPTS